MAAGTGAEQDVISVLVTDHREVEELFARASAAAEAAQLRTITDEIIIELVRHSVAEEQWVYPAVRDLLPDGDALADREIAEHAEAERVMNDLDGLDPEDPRFTQLLGRLMTDIRKHVAEEESELFPQLAARATPEKLLELGKKVTLAKKAAPTRPHPAAPDTPPLNRLLGPGTGLIDRLRDALTHRGKE